MASILKLLNINLISIVQPFISARPKVGCITHFLLGTELMSSTQANLAEKKINVLIVDDHLLLSETVAAGLMQEGRYEIDLVTCFEEAVEKIEQNGRYDVVLLDYQLPDSQGLQALRRMIELNNGSVALFSGVANPSTVQLAMEQGASGFIPKTSSLKRLGHAIHFIADGEVYLQADYLRQFSSSNGDPQFGLKPLELQVLSYLCEGMQNKEIGRALDINETIVKMHVKAICHKLGLRNRTEVALAAVKMGLV